MLLRKDIHILSVVALLNPFSLLIFYFMKGWKNSEFIGWYLSVSIIFLTLSCFLKWKKNITWERACLITMAIIGALTALIFLGFFISMGKAPAILIAE